MARKALERTREKKISLGRWTSDSPELEENELITKALSKPDLAPKEIHIEKIIHHRSSHDIKEFSRINSIKKGKKLNFLRLGGASIPLPKIYKSETVRTLKIPLKKIKKKIELNVLEIKPFENDKNQNACFPSLSPRISNCLIIKPVKYIFNSMH